MSFDDRSLRKDDSPKTRVLSNHPNCHCKKLGLSWFVIYNNGADGWDKYICAKTTAYEAWREAELKLGELK